MSGTGRPFTNSSRATLFSPTRSLLTMKAALPTVTANHLYDLIDASQLSPADRDDRLVVAMSARSGFFNMDTRKKIFEWAATMSQHVTIWSSGTLQESTMLSEIVCERVLSDIIAVHEGNDGNVSPTFKKAVLTVLNSGMKANAELAKIIFDPLDKEKKAVKKETEDLEKEKISQTTRQVADIKHLLAAQGIKITTIRDTGDNYNTPAGTTPAYRPNLDSKSARQSWKNKFSTFDEKEYAKYRELQFTSTSDEKWIAARTWRGLTDNNHDHIEAKKKCVELFKDSKACEMMNNLAEKLGNDRHSDEFHKYYRNPDKSIAKPGSRAEKLAVKRIDVMEKLVALYLVIDKKNGIKEENLTTTKEKVLYLIKRDYFNFRHLFTTTSHAYIHTEFPVFVAEHILGKDVFDKTGRRTGICYPLKKELQQPGELQQSSGEGVLEEFAKLIAMIFPNARQFVVWINVNSPAVLNPAVLGEELKISSQLNTALTASVLLPTQDDNNRSTVSKLACGSSTTPIPPLPSPPALPEMQDDAAEIVQHNNSATLAPPSVESEKNDGGKVTTATQPLAITLSTSQNGANVSTDSNSLIVLSDDNTDNNSSSCFSCLFYPTYHALNYIGIYDQNLKPAPIQPLARD